MMNGGHNEAGIILTYLAKYPMVTFAGITRCPSPVIT